MFRRSMKPKRASARQNGGDLLQRRHPVISGDPGHRQDLHPQHEQMLMQGAVMHDVPHHHRRRITLGAGKEHSGAGHPRYLLLRDAGQEFGAGIRASRRLLKTAVAPRCQIHVMP